jgi:N-methylhydantoinase A/oxoprolinase/acetone carboxylase beta subunit
VRRERAAPPGPHRDRHCGTFSDVVAVDEETGRTTTTKTPSTPADPAEGILTGVRKVLGLLGQPRASWLLPVW